MAEDAGAAEARAQALLDRLAGTGSEGDRHGDQMTFGLFDKAPFACAKVEE